MKWLLLVFLAGCGVTAQSPSETIKEDIELEKLLGKINQNMFKKKLTPSQYTEILFHELTHAWQFATGKLVIENYKVAKYGRKNYDLKEFEYFLQPWEVEAYGYQYCMNRLFWDM